MADAHNPSLVSDHFLFTSKIVQKEEEIKRETLIVTPAMSNVQLSDGTSINIRPDKLMISGSDGEICSERAQKYCSNLPFIQGIAVGINIDVAISNFDVTKWFSQFSHQKIPCNQIRHYDGNSNILSTKVNESSANVQFNFHYDLKGKKPLGQIDIDLVKEWKKNYKKAQSLIRTYFQA